MKKTYRKHNSTIFNKEANLVAALLYLPAYLLLFASWYFKVPKLVSWLVSLMSLLVLLKERSPLVRFHGAQAFVIYFGCTFFLDLFYLCLLGYQVHNTDWGILALNLMTYTVTLLVYILPAYCCVKAYYYQITQIAIAYPLVKKISGYEKYEKGLLPKEKRKR